MERPSAQKSGGLTRRLLQAGVAALVLAGAVAAWGLVVGSEAHASGIGEPATVAAPATVPASFADVVSAVKPAVVSILVSGEKPLPMQVGGQMPPGMDDFLRRFFGAPLVPDHGDRQMPEGQPFQGAGSGFIVSADGLVVTNNHVVQDADDIEVVLADGSRHKAMLRGTDPRTDLALLKIEAGDDLAHVGFGNSDAVRVGDWVVAIGNPFGLGPSVSTGIVSARGRDIHAGPYDDFLQIDAPINRGNSGGPLFDLQGRVIGVNTAIYSPNGGSVGIGFAIPSTMVKEIIDDLAKDGAVERGWLGVQIQALDQDLADAMGLDSDQGALVASVEPNSPAASAGLQAGDVIVQVDGQTVDSPRALARRVAQAGPGADVQLQVLRDGKTLDMTASLKQLADDTPTAPEPAQSKARLGLRVAPLNADVRARGRLPQDLVGVLVTDVDPVGPAARKGIRPGDVIVRAGGQAVKTPADLVAAVSAAADAGRQALALQVWRDGARTFVAVPLED